jgi:hypothetical protein
MYGDEKSSKVVIVVSSKIKSQIDDVIEAILELNGQFPELDSFVNHQSLYNRIDAVMLYAKTRVSQCPAELLFPQDGTEVLGNLNNIQTELTNFFSNANQNHINNVQNNFLPGLVRLIQGRIPTFNEVADPEFLSEVVESSLQKIRVDVYNLVTAFKQEQAALDKNFAEITSKKQSIEAALDEFETETENTIEELKAALGDEHKRIIALNGEFSEQFQISEKDRATEALTAITDFEKKSSEYLSTFTDASKEAISDTKEALRKHLDEDAPSILDQMESMKEDAKKLLHMIGGSTMSDGFSKTADRENKAADLFRIFASLLWIGAAVATGYVIHSLSGEPTVGKVLARVAAVFMLAAPATYMTIESRGHRLESRRAMRYALEMLALEPFLATLDETTRKAKIETLTERYFGNIDKHPPVKEPQMPLEQIVDVCKTFISKYGSKDDG